MSDQAQYTYDVFISYSRPDQEWVQRELLPQLEAAQLKVIIDYRDFEIGVPSVINIERAIDDSRHTLLVLTPDWLASAWTELESLLLSAADPAGRRRKILPLRLRDCVLPPRIAILTYADFTNASRRNAEMARLVKALSSQAPPVALPLPPPKVLPPVDAERGGVQSSPEQVSKSLTILRELMQEPTVRNVVYNAQPSFQTARTHIRIMIDNKAVHDQLHDLQRWYDPIDALARDFPGDTDAWSEIMNWHDQLEQIVGLLRQLVTPPTFGLPEERWIIQPLDRAQHELCEAIEHTCIQQLRGALMPINRVLAGQFQPINTRLNDAARALSLPDLQRAMEQIDGRLRTINLDQDKVSQFAEGTHALTRLDDNLTALVGEHDLWQQVDVDLRRCDAYLQKGDMEELSYSWKEEVQPQLESLYRIDSMKARAQLFKMPGEKVDSAIAGHDLDEARHAFAKFHARASDRFFRVDKELKTLCGKMRDIGDRLDTVLLVMRNGINS